MADKDLTVHLKADDKITPVAKKAAAELKKLEKPIELDADVSGVLGALDQVIAEMKSTATAADALGRALGPEMAGKADLGGVVTDLRQMGATFDDITADADKYAAKLKELADADVGGKLGANLGTARGKTDELRDSARGANSALANMVGNATQDLGVLGGVAGSAGVAIGQMGEYAADAALGGEKLGSALGSMAKVAGPIGAISAVLATISTIMGGIKAKDAFEAGVVEDFNEALKEGETIIQSMHDTLRETGQLMFETGAGGGGGMLGLGSKARDLVPVFEDLGFSTEEWLAMLEDPRGSAERMIAQMEALGTGSIDQQVALEAAAEGLLTYADAGDKAKLADERRKAIVEELGPAIDITGIAAKGMAGAIEDGADAVKTADDNTASYARTIRETAEAARELMGVEGEAADQRRALADSQFAYRDAQRDFAKAITETSDALKENGPATMEGAAALDEFAQQAGSAADAAVRLEADQMTAAGATQDAAQAQRTWNSSMITSARTTSGPLQQSIIDYIATANGIPPEKVTDILADPDYATIEAANAAIDKAAADETARITAEAATAQAERDLAALAARKREAIITARVVAVENKRLGGSLAPSPDMAAVGASSMAATTTATYYPPQTAQIPITIHVPAPPPTTINVNAGVVGNRFDTSRAVTKALRRHQRLNGRRE